MASITRVIFLNELRRVSYRSNIGRVAAFPALLLILSLYILNPMVGEFPFSKTMIVDGLLKVFIFVYSMALGLFIAYVMSMDVYMADKKNKALETLCTSPVSIRQIWAGKTAALIFLAYPAALITSILFWFFANLMVFGTVSSFLEPVMLLHLFVLLPTILFIMIGLGGIGQLISKRYSGANAIFFFIAFGMMWAGSLFMNKIATIPSTTLFFYFVIVAAILLSILHVGRKKLSKEKIILTA